MLVKLVREKLDLSQEKMADNLGLKQAVYSKYENGSLQPPVRFVKNLSDFTGFSMSFFKQNVSDIPSGLIYHRKRSTLATKIRSKVEAEVRLRAIDVQKIAQDFNLSSDLPQREEQTPVNMAQSLRKLWGINNNPIGNLIEELEKHNIFVLKFDFKTDKLDGFFLPLKDNLICIALNDNEVFSPDRQRFTLAHELGHAILHKDILPSKEIEKEANDFASEFLMPKDEIQKELNRDMSLLDLKRIKSKWKMSMQSILFKAHELEIITDAIYRKFFVFLSSQGMKKNEPDCGVLSEKSTLLSNYIEKICEDKDILDYLGINNKIFKGRYPLISVKGGYNQVKSIS